jgi:hypothetical protein
MKTLIKSAVIQGLALLLSASLAFAEERSRYEQPELDQMLAPVALYPDALLSQILMASTYPLEVVQAARWSRANPHLKGQDAVQAVESRDWDPSVKSLTAFPQILSMMDQKLDWTERLGEAFMAQQEQVMDTVQHLRRRAEAAGNLRSDDRARIMRHGEAIIIEPADPHVVYVPYYNPVVVYGPWWWPAYPPVYWAPWPGYYSAPAFVGFHWGSGITISAGFFFGTFDWYHRHVRIVHVHHYHSRPHISRHTTIVYDRPGVWRHDPGHRRGIPYRHTALREEYRHASPRADARRDTQERNAVPVERRDSRQFDSRRDAGNPRRQTEPEVRPAPRVERREEERARAAPGREERENRELRRELRRELPQEPRRELRESRDTQRERPAMQENNRRESRPEPRAQGNRFQQLAEPRPAAAPAARQARPAEVQRPQPAAQHFGERGPRFNGGEPARRSSAGDSPPRAQGSEARRAGGDGPRRPFTPAAGRQPQG